jgi:hypothetical protein
MSRGFGSGAVSAHHGQEAALSTSVNQFAVGQSVDFLPGHSANPSSLGLYTVVRVMPWEQAGWHYHIQNSQDRHIRSAHEHQLKAAQRA